VSSPLKSVLVLTAVGLGLLLLYELAHRLGSHRLSGAPRARQALRRLREPLRWLLVVAGLHIAVGAQLDSSTAGSLILHLLSLLLIGVVAWLLVTATYIVEDLALSRYRLEAEDNLQARRVHTQVMVLRRITVFAAALLGGAAMLMTFPQARTVGTSLLASAGIAGLVAGVAARPVLENVIAGVQIAFSEPIRIDDVVVVEGEWGRVEEITLTFVVVRIWDSRRLVLPISYFVTTPFENWTRTTADLLGGVTLELDFRVPLDELRAELARVVADSPRWDGRVQGLQAIDASATGVQVRALVSARDSGTAWDLRCEVREKLISYIRDHHPESLPRLRVDPVGSEFLHPAAEPTHSPRADQAVDPRAEE
jgi:small-conductance mechanosensitive channel